MPPDQFEAVAKLRQNAALDENSPPATDANGALDPLARSDLEENLAEWLETQEVSNPWTCAPVLADQGWGPERLSAVVEALEPAQRAFALNWLATSATADALLIEITEGATRVGDIVKAVKSYSYLDQAPVQLVDIHEGLDNTLVILRHKLKQGIEVRLNYAMDLPRIEAYASELNQVWTNILDNAIDAMGGRGQMWIATRLEGGRVLVQIANDGPQIPPDALNRIFEAFYTTKEPGKGTGLGLNITYNIVARHHGDIAVTSEPGRTAFTVSLPLALDA